MNNVRRFLFCFFLFGSIAFPAKAIAHPQHCDREEFASRYVASYLPKNGV